MHDCKRPEAVAQDYYRPYCSWMAAGLLIGHNVRSADWMEPQKWLI
jgi:hypothetical protein